MNVALSWSKNAQVLLSLLGYVVFVAQACLMVVPRTFQKKRLHAVVRMVHESLLLVLMLLQSDIIAQVGFSKGEEPPFAHWMFLLRWMVPVAVMVSGVVYAMALRAWYLLVSVPVAALYLPFFEIWLGDSYIYVFLFAALFWLVRVLVLCYDNHRQFGKRISDYSVKEAMDELHSGILFYRENGSVLLVNTRMLALMQEMFSQSYHNGDAFFTALTAKPLNAGCIRLPADQPTVRLKDGSVWLFTHTEISLRRRRCWQLVASDVTALMEYTDELRQENELLQKQADHLKNRLANLQQICQEEELRTARHRIHDALGHRITMLFRALQQMESLDLELIQSLPTDISSLIEPVVQNNDMALEALRNAMGELGIQVQVQGTLPPKPEIAALWVEICTEAVTNAVRHGFADKIDIAFGRDARSCWVQIADNGHGIDKPPQCRGGLLNLSQKVELQLGTLQVLSHRPFVLRAEIGGDP